MAVARLVQISGGSKSIGGGNENFRPGNRNFGGAFFAEATGDQHFAIRQKCCSVGGSFGIHLEGRRQTIQRRFSRSCARRGCACFYGFDIRRLKGWSTSNQKPCKTHD